MSSDRLISKDPSCRAGLYKQIDDIPEHHRLRNYANRFEDRDCWTEYLEEENVCQENISDYYSKDIERRERRWKDFGAKRGKHHALCSPSDAKAYAHYLFEEYSVEAATAADYWAAIERFYRWMFHHTEYPHTYNPFVMAAIDDSVSEELWMVALETN